MARLAFKPDSSFFKKIAIGAVGTRHVTADLRTRGHQMVELERGSTDTKLWKDVKRKRVRIPDLVCMSCGLRVESRAKTKPDLSMSHSETDAERAWDFGMVDDDCVAFPICLSVEERDWSGGRLESDWSYWRERSWVRWQPTGHVNYFRVQAFRATRPARSSTKGVTEGSETTLTWEAKFSNRTGFAERIDGQRITIRRNADGHAYTWSIPLGVPIRVRAGNQIEVNQVIASAVAPLSPGQLACPAQMPERHISRLLDSNERTQRFAGVKLARLLRLNDHRAAISELAEDREEDVYIRLEGASYLCSVAGESARERFRVFLAGPDDQTRLESVIALAETKTPEAVEILCGLLEDRGQPFFLRSAAAWSLGKVGSEQAVNHLVLAFADIDWNIREEALEGIISIGGPGIPILLDGLRQVNADIAAGCAEALRRQQRTVNVNALIEQLRNAPSGWTVWLAGHLPRECVAAAVADLQETAPQLHYALTLLWAFVESWVAQNWELNPGISLPTGGH